MWTALICICTISLCHSWDNFKLSTYTILQLDEVFKTEHGHQSNIYRSTPISFLFLTLSHESFVVICDCFFGLISLVNKHKLLLLCCFVRCRFRVLGASALRGPWACLAPMPTGGLGASSLNLTRPKALQARFTSPVIASQALYSQP